MPQDDKEKKHRGDKKDSHGMTDLWVGCNWLCCYNNIFVDFLSRGLHNRPALVVNVGV